MPMQSGRWLHLLTVPIIYEVVGMKKTVRPNKTPSRERDYDTITVHLYEDTPRDQLVKWMLKNSGLNLNQAAKQMLYDCACRRAKHIATLIHGVSDIEVRFITPSKLLDVLKTEAKLSNTNTTKTLVSRSKPKNETTDIKPEGLSNETNTRTRSHVSDDEPIDF